MPAIPENVAAIVVAAVCVLLLLLLLAIIRLPLKFAVKLLLNMASGLVLLFVFNALGGMFDIEPLASTPSTPLSPACWGYRAWCCWCWYITLYDMKTPPAHLRGRRAFIRTA